MLGFRAAAALVIGVLVLAAPARAAAPALTADEQAAVAWLRTTAAPFADTAPTTPELAQLLPHLDGARIIGIGEATHGDHQEQSFKAELIKALVRGRRIDTLALECNRQAGADFDAYVHGGDGDLVALVRSKSFFRTWQDDEFAGLILWLRAWNATTTAAPIRIIGIDNQDAIRDASFALDFIARHDAALATQLRAGIAPMFDDPKTAKLQFYKWVVATPRAAFDRTQAGVTAIAAVFDTHGTDWAAFTGFDDARYAARTAVQGMNQFELEAGDPDFDLGKAPPGYDIRRDVFMAANLVERSAGHPSAFWAHDVHVIGDVDPVLAARGWRPMGSDLRRALGNAYVTVGFVWGAGSFNSRHVADRTSTGVGNSDWVPTTLPGDVPGTLGHVFAAAGGERFWVDLREAPPAVLAWGKTRYYRGWAGATTIAAKWNANDDERAATIPSFDLLVWFRTITPSHMWPKLPG